MEDRSSNAARREVLLARTKLRVAHKAALLCVAPCCIGEQSPSRGGLSSRSVVCTTITGMDHSVLARAYSHTRRRPGPREARIHFHSLAQTSRSRACCVYLEKGSVSSVGTRLYAEDFTSGYDLQGPASVETDGSLEILESHPVWACPISHTCRHVARVACSRRSSCLWCPKSCTCHRALEASSYCAWLCLLERVHRRCPPSRTCHEAVEASQ